MYKLYFKVFITFDIKTVTPCVEKNVIMILIITLCYHLGCICGIQVIIYLFIKTLDIILVHQVQYLLILFKM